MIIAKYARVVHSPLESMFVVQYKTWWFCKWAKDIIVHYYREGSQPSPCGTPYNQIEARAKAFHRVEILLERSVVHDENGNSELTAEYNRGFEAARAHFATDVELGNTAMRFVDRAGDVHPGIDDAETICADFYKAMCATLEKHLPWLRK